jgi:hypothetical protein
MAGVLALHLIQHLVGKVETEDQAAAVQVVRHQEQHQVREALAILLQHLHRRVTMVAQVELQQVQPLVVAGAVLVRLEQMVLMVALVVMVETEQHLLSLDHR